MGATPERVHADVVAAPEVIHSSAATNLTPSCAQTSAVNSSRYRYWHSGLPLPRRTRAAVISWSAVDRYQVRAEVLGRVLGQCRRRSCGSGTPTVAPVTAESTRQCDRTNDDATMSHLLSSSAGVPCPISIDPWSAGPDDPGRGMDRGPGEPERVTVMVDWSERGAAQWSSTGCPGTFPARPGLGVGAPIAVASALKAVLFSLPGAGVVVTLAARRGRGVERHCRVPTRTCTCPPRRLTAVTSVQSRSTAVHGWALMSAPPAAQASRASGAATWRPHGQLQIDHRHPPARAGGRHGPRPRQFPTGDQGQGVGGHHRVHRAEPVDLGHVRLQQLHIAPAVAAGPAPGLGQHLSAGVHTNHRPGGADGVLQQGVVQAGAAAQVENAHARAQPHGAGSR